MWPIAWWRESERPKAWRSRAKATVRSQAMLHRADRSERHRQALPLEVGHDQREALVQAAEQVLFGDEHILEADRGRVGGVPAELVELRGADALAAVDDQEGDAVVAALGVGLHGRDDEMGAQAIGDVGLLAVDHPTAVRALGAVRSAATSEPAPGSVIPSAPIFSPAIAGTR